LSPSSPNVGENISHDGTAVVPPWKKELNERLAATRSRRLHNREEQVPLPGLEHMESKVESRASRLAAKVAQRYANAPSYSEVLAAEARARLEMASAVSRSATDDAHFLPQSREVSSVLTDSWNPSLDTETVVSSHSEELGPSPEPEEGLVSAAVEPLAVNLIDFPRELVAPRRVRPRLAEGPLRETSQAQHDQLKIFEVAPESVSQTVKIETVAADWSPIRLDADPALRPNRLLHSQEVPLKTAPLEHRLMAGIFDLALVVAAFAIFVLVFVACTAHPPTGKAALLGAGLVLAGFCLLYQYLFLKFAEGTPGMRYAKIALCTFEDENPTRKAMCKRVLFLLLSAAPLGLGFAWALFDPDRLGWHDRLSRIYQRSYS
jgi:uncharacterized RDD family membrane protein YckC